MYNFQPSPPLQYPTMTNKWSEHHSKATTSLPIPNQPDKAYLYALRSWEVFFLAGAPATRNEYLGVRCDFLKIIS